jgi:glycosyltransferase involved in cell wall biosynthesis
MTTLLTPPGHAERPVLVHDYLLVMRGAERSFARIADMWPGAPISTLLYDPEVFGERLAGHPVRTSRLQRLGARQSTYKALLPALPAAAERLPVAGHGLVISSSSAFAHGVTPDEDAVHVCYCYTPFRYAWYEQEAGIMQAPRPARPILRRTLRGIQRWDHRKAQRGTRYVAISRLSQDRIRQYWGLDADIVHPPVELHRFTQGSPGDHLLFVGELVRHKQAEVALEAAREARMPIKVVGSGADESRLRARYSGSAEFLGRVEDEELATLYASCRALIVPSVEEFGLTAVEAQASGRPVIAADGGGTRETVIEGQTGYFFQKGDAAGLTRILRSGAIDRLNAGDAVRNAERFSVQRFQEGIRQQVEFAMARSQPVPR